MFEFVKEKISAVNRDEDVYNIKFPPCVKRKDRMATGSGSKEYFLALHHFSSFQFTPDILNCRALSLYKSETMAREFLTFLKRKR